MIDTINFVNKNDFIRTHFFLKTKVSLIWNFNFDKFKCWVYFF